MVLVGKYITKTIDIRKIAVNTYRTLISGKISIPKKQIPIKLNDIVLSEGIGYLEKNYDSLKKADLSEISSKDFIIASEGLAKIGKSEESLKLLQLGVEKNSLDFMLVVNLADKFKSLKNNKEALFYFKKALLLLKDKSGYGYDYVSTAILELENQSRK